MHAKADTFQIAMLLSGLCMVQHRRRRMHGVSRLQEVPMSFQAPYMEDKYLVALNGKILAQQQQSAEL